MGVFEQPSYDGHEEVVFVRDEDSGLRAIIAIHSTRLGPAAGGCRMWRYADEAAAVDDALRLSRGMSYKNAVAGLPLGGGKTVIFDNPALADRGALFEAFGAAVDKLGGRYVTAEDVGVGVADMQAVSRATRYVAGLPAPTEIADAPGGDPSPKTAHGVFHGIVAAVRHQFKRNDLHGLVVAVQGLGAVGQHLCEKLHDAGARLLVADLDGSRVTRMQQLYRAQALSAEEILSAPCDVLAPCAMGGILNEQTIPNLRTRVVAGAANNQLRTEADGNRLRALGILYAPDYVINAGGIINVGAEYLKRGSQASVWADIAQIDERLSGIFEEAESTELATNMVADRLARRLIGR